MKHVCLVCGYRGLEEQPYIDMTHMKEGSFEICICCRFQYGVDDDIQLEDGSYLSKRDTHNIYRTIWINLEAPVFSLKKYPIELQKEGKVKQEILEEQGKNIGVHYSE
ncbi:hypothetical protein NDK25_24375 [Niallia taxi]|nr:hypothetical protein [Niallia taxi]